MNQRNPIVALVRIKCVRRLCCTAEEMGRELAAEIAPLRIIASLREISRELRPGSTRYAWRFFRVLGSSPAELGRDGNGPSGHGSRNGFARDRQGDSRETVECTGFMRSLYRIQVCILSVGEHVLPDRDDLMVCHFLNQAPFAKQGQFKTSFM